MRGWHQDNFRDDAPGRDIKGRHPQRAIELLQGFTDFVVTQGHPGFLAFFSVPVFLGQLVAFAAKALGVIVGHR